MRIKTLPESERPYEKLEMYGEKELSNAELLAIIIKTGTKDKTAIELSQEILNKGKSHISNNLRFLQDISIDELIKIKGIGKVKAIEIKAVCEIAKRMSKPIKINKIKILSPKDVANIMMDELRFEKTEKLKVLILNTKNILLKVIEVVSGASNLAIIDPKDILIEAIRIGAPKIILVHNHPSGETKPSKADLEITNRVKRAAEIIGITLIDHIVIGDGEYTSIFLSKRGR